MFLDSNRQIRVLAAQERLTLGKLADMLTEKTEKKYSRTSFSNRINAGTLRYDEVLKIADLLGYDIKFEKRP